MQNKLPLTQLYYKAIKELENVNYPDAQRVAGEIINYITGNKLNVFSDFINKEQYDILFHILNGILKEISLGKPFEYITKSTEFMGQKLSISNSCLIPRIETEQLVQIAYNKISFWIKKNSLSSKPIYVLDIGTGSGCLTVALSALLKRNFLNMTLYFISTDISEKALDIAKRNVKEKNSAKYSFYKANILNGIPDSLIKELRENPVFIISNPPYIPNRVYKKLDKSVKDYEPARALKGGKLGTKYYKRLKKQLKTMKIEPKGIFLEIDPSIRKRIVKIFKKGYIVKDCFGQKRFWII